jgi:hypothetical protein
MIDNESWRCFHCNTVFTSRKWAAEHFGADESATPACKLTNSEGHLVTYIRKLEAELAAYRDERDEILMAWNAMQSDNLQAVIRAEEKGYGKGVRDAKRMFEDEGERAELLGVGASSSATDLAGE